MSDAAPYGWSAKNTAGLLTFYTGAQPPTGCTEVTEYTSLTDYQAALDLARNPPLTLDQVKANKSAALSADCQAAILTGGFASSALGSVHGYPTDDKSQMNLAASVTASLMPNLPAGWTTPFWCADQTGAWSFAPHTAAQIQQVGLDGKTMVVAAQQKLATLNAQVAAATTVDAVAAIAWS